MKAVREEIQRILLLLGLPFMFVAIAASAAVVLVVAAFVGPWILALRIRNRRREDE